MPNSKLSNSSITISGTSVSLGGSITDETLFGGIGVVTGSVKSHMIQQLVLLQMNT